MKFNIIDYYSQLIISDWHEEQGNYLVAQQLRLLATYPLIIWVQNSINNSKSISRVGSKSFSVSWSSWNRSWSCSKIGTWNKSGSRSGSWSWRNESKSLSSGSIRIWRNR